MASYSSCTFGRRTDGHGAYASTNLNVFTPSFIRYYGSNDDASRLAYEYSVRRVPDSEFKYEEPIYAGDGSGSVTILNRHGIRLVIKQIGSHGGCIRD